MLSLLTACTRSPTDAIASARAELAAGQPQAAVLVLKDALQRDESHAADRAELGRTLLLAGDAAGALVELRKAEAGGVPADQVLRARAHQAAGQPQQAVQLWRQALAASPQSPELLAALAQAHRAAGDATSANQRLQQALAAAPGHLGSLQALLDDSLARRDNAAALRWARQAQARHPRSPVGWQWEGAVHAARKDGPQALAAWRQAQAKAESADTAMKLYSALRAAGQGADALALLADWQRRHPADTRLPRHAADALAAAGDHAGAEALYRQVIDRHPQDAHALNNLAWVRLPQREGDAASWAEKAVAADPGQPDALDTLAQAWAAAGQPRRALELQQQAVALAPRRAGLRLTLVRLALQAGEKKLAGDELATLTTQDARLAQRPEVQALLAQVR